MSCWYVSNVSIVLPDQRECVGYGGEPPRVRRLGVSKFGDARTEDCFGRWDATLVALRKRLVLNAAQAGCLGLDAPVFLLFSDPS